MFSDIILRDFLKDSAQLDLSVFEIREVFRGVAEIQPCIHYK